MNCLEFRRVTLSDPGHLDQDTTQHLDECSQCAEYYSGLLDFESNLSDAINIDPPADLAARVMMNANLKQANRFVMPKTWVRFAAAASVAFAVFLIIPFGTDTGSVDAMVLEHIEHEPYAFKNVKQLDTAMVNKVLNDIGFELDGEALPVTYAMGCILRGTKGAHLVLAGESGPVTVMVMPGEHIAQPQTIAHAKYSGIIVPTSTGSIAIVGDANADVSGIETIVRNAIARKA